MLKKIITTLFFLLSFSIQASELIEGTVIGVHDGDTITLLIAGNQQIKVRLAQIDAPELAQDFGQNAQQSLSELVMNKDIKVEKETIDKYGRTVGTLFVAGLDANREQVKRGMAWVYRQYMHDQTLLQAEDNAKRTKLGLWTGQNPVAPWDFRHGGQ